MFEQIESNPKSIHATFLFDIGIGVVEIDLVACNMKNRDDRSTVRMGVNAGITYGATRTGCGASVERDNGRREV